MDQGARIHADYLQQNSRLSEGRDLWSYSQLRRPAASIGAKIAEGCGRRSDGERSRFLQIARGSASEPEYHLLLSRDLELLQTADFAELEEKTLEIQRMLASLAARVKRCGGK